jgi:hypothetical protein
MTIRTIRRTSAFPGYGSGGFVEQSRADGTVLRRFSVEVPLASKQRYFIFEGNDGVYTLVDDFVCPDTAGLLRSVIRRGNDLVFAFIDGKEALVPSVCGQMSLGAE